MNWVDFLIILFLIIFAWEGKYRGFFHETFDFLSFLIAFLLSLRFYNYAGSFLQNNLALPHSLANILGFILVWFLIETFLICFFPLVYSKFKLIPRFDNFEKLTAPLGVIPALLRGIIFVSIILVLVGTFPIQPQIKKAVDNSKIGSYIVAKTAQVEAPLKNIFGGVTQDTLTFLTIRPEGKEKVDLGFQTTNFSENESLENQMIDLVNRERASRSLQPVIFDPKLREVARSHSRDMFERGYFSHYSPEGESVVDRARKYDISYLVIGENLAYAPSLRLAHNGLMNSPGHRANILSADFGKIGIGIMDGGSYGLMITQVFSN